MAMPYMACKIRGFKENVVVYWLLCIITQTLFFRNKHIISRIMHLLHNKFVLVCNILMWEELFLKRFRM